MTFYKRAFCRAKFPEEVESDFLVAMQDPITLEFSENGYFAKRTNPFEPLFNAHNIGSYITNMKEHIDGFYNLFVLHMLEFDEDTRATFMPTMTRDERKDFFTALDKTYAKLNPEIVLEQLKEQHNFDINAEELRKSVNRHFGFNFRKAKIAVHNLGWALNCTTTDENKEQVKAYLDTGPVVLEKLTKLYDTVERYLNEHDVESRHNYPQLAEKLKIPLRSLSGIMDIKLTEADPIRDDLAAEAWQVGL